jgi:hypothetical protein
MATSDSGVKCVQKGPMLFFAGSGFGECLEKSLNGPKFLPDFLMPCKPAEILIAANQHDVLALLEPYRVVVSKHTPNSLLDRIR